MAEDIKAYLLCNAAQRRTLFSWTMPAAKLELTRLILIRRPFHLFPLSNYWKNGPCSAFELKEGNNESANHDEDAQSKSAADDTLLVQLESLTIMTLVGPNATSPGRFQITGDVPFNLHRDAGTRGESRP